MIQGGPTWVVDGLLNTVGGMDSSKTPDLLGESYYALGVNVVTRGGRARTRPGFSQMEFSGVTPELSKILQRPFLGASTYFRSGDATVVTCFGGALVEVDPWAGSIAQLAAPAMDFYADCYFCQAERFLIIQNGLEPPLIYDGQSVRRARSGTNNPDVVISALSQSSGLATATTATPHGFSSGDYIQIQGAAPAGYNMETYITVTGAAGFTYAVDSPTPSPATVTSASCRYAPEIPMGTCMVYGQGRLFVASPDRKTFTAGDIIFGDTLGTADNLLRFTENLYLAEGGSFGLPALMGDIIDMVIVPQQDSTTGQGELLVLGEFGVGSFAVSTPRSVWKNTQIQKVTFTSIGGVSDNGAASVNNDLVFRTNDGLQTYRQARSDLGGYGQTAMSLEMSEVFNKDVKHLLTHASSVYSQNRLLTTCAPASSDTPLPVSSIVGAGGTLTVVTEWPHRASVGDIVALNNSSLPDGDYEILSTPNDVTFTAAFDGSDFSEDATPATVSTENAVIRTVYRGVVSLDFVSLMGVGGRKQAAYDGVWTGLEVLQLLAPIKDGEADVVAIASARNGSATFWRLGGPTTDYLGDNNIRQKCVVETRAFTFGKPFVLKKLIRGDLWLSDIIGEVDVRVFYRTDNRYEWHLWHDFSVCADAVPPVDVGEFKAPQSRCQQRLPTPKDVCDPVDKQITRCGYTFQLRIEWDGVCRLDKCLLHALEQLEQVGGDCL